MPVTYLDTLCSNLATISSPTHSGPASLIVVSHSLINGLYFEVNIADPATFTSFASADGEITTVNISDNSAASQDIDFKIYNPCFTSTFDAATVFTSPAIDPAGYDVYYTDPGASTATIADYATF